MIGDGFREGFAGEKVYRLSRDQIERARKDSLFSGLYVTDVGYFPNAVNHLVERRKRPLREAILIYCVGGEGWFETDDGRKTVTAGRRFVIPPGTPHSYGSESGWQIYWVHFGGERTADFLEKLGAPLDPMPVGGESAAAAVFEKMIRRAEDGQVGTDLSYLHYAIWHLLGIVASSEAYPDHAQGVNARLDASIHFMKEHLSECLTLADMAEHAGYSASHFSQLFRDHTGRSPVDFHIQLKIQRAAKILAATKTKVVDVARMSGYDNAYYFSRLFRKVTGYAPRDYRQRFQV